MSNLSTHIPTAAHPSWCERRSCETDAQQTYHMGAPVTWETVDAQFELSLRRTDAHRAAPDDPGEIALWVTNTALEGAVGEQVYLSAAEARDLAHRLVIIAAQVTS